MDPAHLPIIFAQVSDVPILSDALQKNFHTTVTACLCIAVVFLWRELRAEQIKRFSDIQGNQTEIKALYKELIPLISKTVGAVEALERISIRITKE